MKGDADANRATCPRVSAYRCASTRRLKNWPAALAATADLAEGPVWWHEGGYLLFSDIGHNRRMKWAPGEGVSLDHEPTNEANGLTRDRQGRLVACEHLARRVTRRDPDGSLPRLRNPAG